MNIIKPKWKKSKHNPFRSLLKNIQICVSNGMTMLYIIFKCISAEKVLL